ncbi:peptidoglycan editing factor PgeF [Aliidiomarina taiwanensis]|uniref:Purine nucleoside phosphorylase n=1 Tax=Aliidiomarina taiwanensis TaxID=946228 RepID=A0A432WYZ2_9GAMM|nr:peptidoglycan editing factor PgeF [Aliidiomarina taiwanensis]RUO39030.1 peptidoglycan editing factor PgeF [Aliidiomarina taiwanensis]
MIETVAPRWQVNSRVHGFTTLRSGGVSTGPYAALNLGLHVGDNEAAVRENRLRVSKYCHLPPEVHWLQQVHGTDVVHVSQAPQLVPEADASYTRTPQQVLAIMTADCLPLFIADHAGTEIALLHCGWRSVAGGIIERTLASFQTPTGGLHAWLGPAIGPLAFEVGDDVVQAMVQMQPNHLSHFKASGNRWLLDLPALVTAELSRHGVYHVSSSGQCTYSESERFFSYRRDGQTGRMASFLWLAAPPAE